MLVGFRARNHRQQERRDDVDDRRTPRAFFEARHAIRSFTVDAAASEANALLPRFWSLVDSGLEHPWTGERVWCNPPYSDLMSWTRKAHEEIHAAIDMLLPANRPEQRWWQTYIEPYRDRGGRLTTSFLPGRMRFGHPDSWERPKKGDRFLFGCVLAMWEPV